MLKPPVRRRFFFFRLWQRGVSPAGTIRLECLLPGPCDLPPDPRPESSVLLAAIKRFLSHPSEPPAGAGADDERIQLAAAALLFHVIAVDGVASEDERAMLTGLLARRFDLDPAHAASLVSAAESADAEAVDLYGFTSVLKRTLDVGDRERVIEMMWKLVYADGTVHEFEDNAVWRVAELLGVPSQTRIRLKKTVRDNAAH